jgi:hypothetical protein
LFFENLRVHEDFNSQSGNSLGSVEVHSLTLSYTLGGMKCDSRASLLAHTFVNFCLALKPKARVVTHTLKNSMASIHKNDYLLLSRSMSTSSLSLKYSLIITNEIIESLVLPLDCMKFCTIDAKLPMKSKIIS